MAESALRKTLVHFLKSWLQKLEPEESISVRSTPKPWHQREVHFPPFIVTVISGTLLAVILFLSVNPSPSVLFALAAFVGLLLGFFIFYVRLDFPELARDDDAMSLLAFVCLLTILLEKFAMELHHAYSWFSPYAAPLALAPLFISLLLHPRLAVVVCICLSIIFGLINNNSLGTCLISFFGGAIAVAAGYRVPTRSHVTQTGLKIAAIQTLCVWIIGILEGWPLSDLLWQSVWASISGVLTSLLCLGLLPYLESFFSRLSPIKLLELSDVNHPLLKRMSLEAPGTYHHSLIMGSLADAAASAVGANNLLARVGAYFHDIGKLIKPEYFVENQETRNNPHNDVSPSMSKLIIISHVKEGLALASLHRLDKSIAAFIPMHHGNSKVEYFYHKAVETEQDAPSEESFRYPGPRPNTKETAIVMLADSIEASSRTLEEPTHQRFQDLVYRIVNRKLFDGQLEEAPLTLRDLRKISDSFVNTLMGIYHARIKYPSVENLSEGLVPETHQSPPQT